MQNKFAKQNIKAHEENNIVRYKQHIPQMREFTPEVMKNGHFSKEDFQINKFKFLKGKIKYNAKRKILK